MNTGTFYPAAADRERLGVLLASLVYCSLHGFVVHAVRRLHHRPHALCCAVLCSRACGCRCEVGSIVPSCTSAHPPTLPHIPDIVARMWCHPSKSGCLWTICAEVPDGENARFSVSLCSTDDSGQITQKPRRNTAPHSGRLHLGFLCPASQARETR